MEPVHKLIPVRSTRPSPSEARAFRLTSATSGGGDEHVANDDNDGRNADSDGRNTDSDDTDSMDSTPAAPPAPMTAKGAVPQLSASNLAGLVSNCVVHGVSKA